MQLIRQLALVVAAALPCSAFAGDLGSYYVGVRGGVTASGIDSDAMTRQLKARGHAVVATVDDSDAGGHLYIGKRVSLRSALELGYTELGRYDVRVTGTTALPLAQLARDIAATQPVSGHGVSLVLRHQIPLIGSLALNPRLGGFYWRSENDIVTNGARTRIDDDGFGLLIGLGLDYPVVAGLHLGLGWELQRPSSQGATSLLFGQAEYHFGN